MQKLANEEIDDLPALLTLGNIYSLMGYGEQAREAFSIFAKNARTHR